MYKPMPYEHANLSALDGLLLSHKMLHFKTHLTKQGALLPSCQLTAKTEIWAPPTAHADSQRELPGEATQPSQCGSTRQIRPITAPRTELGFHCSESPYLRSVNYGTRNNPTAGVVRRDVKSTITTIAALKINGTKLLFHA